ncbi:10971_t:CDS:2 [Scutellospora calospora]|uniref:10971_t:CDS:1 n=1 Tax=Scutellospora calospora TaxID=85575 RepID=A0ACA9JVD0_9GLOM|nr:10971_t:CDS:2 [Scutellospora calospora]
MDNTVGQKDSQGNEDEVVSYKNESENVKEVNKVVGKRTEGKDSTISNTYSESTSTQKDITGDTSQSSTTEIPAKVTCEPDPLEPQRQDIITSLPKSSVNQLITTSNSTSTPYKPNNMFFKNENLVASDLQTFSHLNSDNDKKLSEISEDVLIIKKESSDQYETSIPLNVLSSNINKNIVPPKQIIRIERDYTRGEMCQFQSAFPLEIEGRVNPRQFQQTINGLNELLTKALNPKYNWFDNCLTCVTIYVSTLCIRPHYEKIMKIELYTI